MFTQNPDPPKKSVRDYDFLLSNGMLLPVSLHPDDEIIFNTDHILLKMAARPSLADPAIFMPDEEILVYKAHILSISHRKREIDEISPKEWSDMMDLGKKSSTIIQ